MKKVVLTSIGVAVIVLAAINVNIALKSEGISKSIMANIVALADNENPGGGENGGNGTILWERTDGDCVYTFTGKAGAKITIFGGTIITIGTDGTATYTYGNGKTECASGGNQQCTARYCPPI
ncbi:MAG: hypothetical protein LBL04_14235 [Bacteroidales bacterium]|jgi:hypothetical protein|nr:hypothetical protein [Bacteroidales bacterium]